MEHKIVGQIWTESERGWGQRPDGFTLHDTKESCTAWVKKYWASMPSTSPDTYSFPDGDSFEVYVTEEVFEKITSNDNKTLVSWKRFPRNKTLTLEDIL